MVQRRAAEMPSLWACMLGRIDFNDPDILEGPRGRMFHDMLVAFPHSVGVKADDMARLMADADDLDKMTVAFHLQKILTGEDEDDGLCNGDFLSDLKARVFLRHFSKYRLAGMHDDALYKVFMLCLSGPPTQIVCEARAHFYESAPIPEALKAYHRAAWKRMEERVLSGEGPDSLAFIVSGWKAYDCLGLPQKLRWVEAVSHLIAKAYDVPEPYTSPLRYNGPGGAACGLINDKGIKSSIHYKLDVFETPSSMLSAIFHEVAGHAVENVLARRANPEIWNALDISIRKHYSTLKPDTALHCAALLMAFNISTNHKHGHYTPISKNFSLYRNQIIERVAAWVEEEGSAALARSLNLLWAGLEDYTSLDRGDVLERFSEETLSKICMAMTPK